MIELTYFGKKRKNDVGNLFVKVKEKYVNGCSVITELPHIVRHSPDGFQWGYGGSGPSDLALSILTHFCENRGIEKRIAEDLYQDFKKKFISSAGDSLKIQCYEIEEWLKEKKVFPKHE